VPPPAPPAPSAPVFIPEAPAAEQPEPAEEPTVFEAVLEEDLEFGAPEYAPEPEPIAEPQPEPLEEVTEQPEATQDLGDESIFAPELTVRSPYSRVEGGASGAFAALVQGQVAVPDGAADTAAFDQPLVPAPPDIDEAAPEPAAPSHTWEAEDLALPEPEPIPEEAAPVVPPAVPAPEPAPAPPAAASAAVPEKLAIEWARPAVIERPEAQPEPVEPEPVPLVSDLLPLQAARAPVAPEETTFADVAEAVAEPGPPPSEAATMGVPVETVEKIAQRVVAQISEKAVREIAWEVIPDLAEALIKQEIERLKAELAKL
jgi:hypothetical protein